MLFTPCHTFSEIQRKRFQITMQIELIDFKAFLHDEYVREFWASDVFLSKHACRALKTTRI